MPVNKEIPWGVCLSYKRNQMKSFESISIKVATLYHTTCYTENAVFTNRFNAVQISFEVVTEHSPIDFLYYITGVGIGPHSYVTTRIIILGLMSTF